MSRVCKKDITESKTHVAVAFVEDLHETFFALQALNEDPGVVCLAECRARCFFQEHPQQRNNLPTKAMVGLQKGRTKTFKTGKYLRHRLVLSTLSSLPIRITEIRPDDTEAPGLSPAEISFIRLIDKLTKGSTIQINETGTSLLYKPGLLLGGSRVSHVCHPTRALAYYLEPLLMLAPFCKHPLSITLTGPTHMPTDICVDTLSAVTVPLLRRLTLGTDLSPSLEVRKRAAGSPELNGSGKAGTLQFRCNVLTGRIKPIELLQAGYVKRVRGVAFGNKVSPAFISRIVDVTRGVLNKFTPDVYVHTDHNNTRDGGVGFGLHLVAETTEGCLLGADWSGVEKDAVPEDVARDAVNMLLEEVEAAGCVDSSNTCLALLFCALADADLNTVRVGRLSEAAVQFLRDINTFFGVMFKIKMEREFDSDSEDDVGDEEEQEDGRPAGIVMSCIGCAHTNVARQRF